MAEKSFFEILGEEAPAVSKAFFELGGAIAKDAGLDEKTFQLCYIAISAHKSNVGSVRGHAGLAKKAGATRAEVRGAVLVSLMTDGIQGTSNCIAAALEGYDSAE